MMSRELTLDNSVFQDHAAPEHRTLKEYFIEGGRAVAAGMGAVGISLTAGVLGYCGFAAWTAQKAGEQVPAEFNGEALTQDVTEIIEQVGGIAAVSTLGLMVLGGAGWAVFSALGDEQQRRAQEAQIREQALANILDIN